MINDSPVSSSAEITAACDRSGKIPLIIALGCSLFWLLVGSLLGDLASVKLHFPDLLSFYSWLTFGRIRPAHLNTMIYGWATNGMFAVSLWLLPRLLRTPLQWRGAVIVGVLLWNWGLLLGTVGLLAGITDGMEWLELHRYLSDSFLLEGALLIGAAHFRTLRARRVEHLYVSVWYIIGAYLWFPVIFLIGNLPIFWGVENAAVNWFYAHNALGLWLTAINLAAVYYLLPKILGRPIYSYWLSLVGFWSLAFFYSLNGMHHLIGGPLPSWMIATSVTASVMMIIPVAAVAVNHHFTMVGRFAALRYSPTLTFIVIGAMSYTAVSLQGIMQSLVEVNRVTHFTHWTIAHAHMGVYSFVTFVLFGSMYYLLPRVLEKEWPSARMIRGHFWCVILGISLYIFGLAIGGVRQGIILNTTTQPFSESVQVTLPWLMVRSVAGGIITIGHILFIIHVLWLLKSAPSNERISPWHVIRPILIKEGA